MKTKTINKNLNNKIGDWIESIPEDRGDVRKAIRNGAIVTGGSIASMLLREDVNDYDVYFSNKEDLLTVVKYYAGMKQIEVIDGANVVNNQEDLVTKLSVSDDEEYATQLSSLINRVDKDRVVLFMPNVSYREFDKPENQLYDPVYFTENAITLTDQIQIVIRFWGSPEEIHKNYDFVHATNYYTAKDEKLVLNQEALESLITKELKYIGSLYPVTSAIRVNKFIRRGFTINAGEQLKILYQISELNLNDYSVLQDQLVGVDIAYFSILLNALKPKMDKGEKITFSFISTIIEKIFNT